MRILVLRIGLRMFEIPQDGELLAPFRRVGRERLVSGKVRQSGSIPLAVVRGEQARIEAGQATGAAKQQWRGEQQGRNARHLSRLPQMRHGKPPSGRSRMSAIAV